MQLPFTTVRQSSPLAHFLTLFCFSDRKSTYKSHWALNASNTVCQHIAFYLNSTASSMACSDWHNTAFCSSAPADMDPVDHFLSIFFLKVTGGEDPHLNFIDHNPPLRRWIWQITPFSCIVDKDWLHCTSKDTKPNLCNSYILLS
jgi:hypothetical protein